MPKKPCASAGCASLVDRGYCEQHKQLSSSAINDKRRGSSAKRGYGYRWQQARDAYIKRNGLCVDPHKPSPHPGRYEFATDVDHIVPVSGPHDPLFWEPTNWQALCHACHSYKTATEDGGFGIGGRGSKSPTGPKP